jgi:hypothetical protein
MQENYKAYPYGHFSKGSKPSITAEKIDTNVAQILDVINNTPDITDEQLEYIQIKIKEKIREKQKYYLEKKSNESIEKTPMVRFSEGTKNGGKTKRRRNNNKKHKKKSRHNRH